MKRLSACKGWNDITTFPQHFIYTSHIHFCITSRNWTSMAYMPKMQLQIRDIPISSVKSLKYFILVLGFLNIFLLYLLLKSH